eukprot:g57614.t1
MASVLARPLSCVALHIHRGCAAVRCHSSQVRVRYAPSPTGQLHLGGLRTALFNYLLAKRHNGKFILRIEDTDQTRLVPGAAEQLSKTLEHFGLVPDEGPRTGGPYGPYTQSERLELYRTHANILRDKQAAYPCFCTKERLQRLKKVQMHSGVHNLIYDRRCLSLPAQEVAERIRKGEPHVYRLRMPEGHTAAHDLVKGHVVFQNDAVDDQVLLKTDGWPTYHLCSVVDDHHMQISHVIRGEEWLPSLPKHLALYTAFGWEPPLFAHLPLLINSDGSKLSKRNADSSVDYYLEQGFLTEAVINFVALLGWSPPDSESKTSELLSMHELIQSFALDRVQISPATVDQKKLQWMNTQYFRNKIQRASREVAAEVQEQLRQLFPHSERARDQEYVARVLETVSQRVHSPKHFLEVCSPYFVDPDYTSDAARAFAQQLQTQGTELSPSLLSALTSQLRAIPAQGWQEEALGAALHEFREKHQLSQKQLLLPLRYILTASQGGPAVPSLLQVLGSTTSLRLLQAFTSHPSQPVQ